MKIFNSMRKLDYTSPLADVVILASLRDTLAATSSIPDITETDDSWD